MGIRAELLALTEQISQRLPLPKVRQVYIPEAKISADKEAEFGVLELQGGACGLFYAWLGESQQGMSRRFVPGDLVGADAIVIARYLGGNDDMTRSLGLAAVNAITQYFFACADVELEPATSSMAGLSLQAGDRLGMVGHFPSLVRQAQQRGIAVTVVERKSHMVIEKPGLSISLDPESLRSCNKIICTAATLINDSVEEMLGFCDHADCVAMIGPSASFFPDPLFANGVDVIGGARVKKASETILAQRHGNGLRNCTSRYSLAARTYPGTLRLSKRFI